MEKKINKESRWMGPYTKYPNVDVYNSFRNAYPKYKDVSNERLKKIIDTFNLYIADGIVENPEGIELPEGLGIIMVISCERSKKENINYGLLNKTGQKVKFTNFGTNNRLCKIYYSNRLNRLRFAMKECFVFKPADLLKDKVSKSFRKNYRKYLSVPNYSRLNYGNN